MTGGGPYLYCRCFFQTARIGCARRESESLRGRFPALFPPTGVRPAELSSEDAMLKKRGIDDDFGGLPDDEIDDLGDEEGEEDLYGDDDADEDFDEDEFEEEEDFGDDDDLDDADDYSESDDEV